MLYELRGSRFRMPLNLQFFSGGDPGGGDPNGGKGDPEPKTYTEDEYKNALKEAKKTAAEAAIKKRFGDLADMDIEEIKAAVELKRKQDEEKNKGKGKDSKDDPVDVEKLLEDKLKEKQKEQDERTFKRLLAADVKVLANELGFADWEDALTLADFTEVNEDDKGNLTGVKEAMEALAKKKPHLLKQQKKGGGSFGADIGGSGGGDDQKRRTEDLIKAAQSRGAVSTTAAYNPWGSK